jgi:hypothetical protein
MLAPKTCTLDVDWWRGNTQRGAATPAGVP